jgi:hypothetical protein
MRSATLGPALALIAGSATLVVAALLSAWDSSTLPLVIATGLLGFGAAGLIPEAPAVMARRKTRFGLGVLAAGMLGVMFGYLSLPSPLPRGEELIEQGGILIVLGGVLLGGVGMLVTGLSLVLSSDDRSIGAGFGLLGGGFFGGLLLTFSNWSIVGVALIAVGLAGVGLLALASARREPASRAGRA